MEALFWVTDIAHRGNTQPLPPRSSLQSKRYVSMTACHSAATPLTATESLHQNLMKIVASLFPTEDKRLMFVGVSGIFLTHVKGMSL